MAFFYGIDTLLGLVFLKIHSDILTRRLLNIIHAGEGAVDS